MENNKVEMTLIANKERLNHYVERAQNIFKVVAQNYDSDVISFVDDLYLAIKYPLKVSGWGRDWSGEEKSQLDSSSIKCMETMSIANDAKKTVMQLLENLNKLYAELSNFSSLGEKTEDYINKFTQYVIDFKLKISFLESKSEITRQEDAWLQELKNNLFFLEDSLKILEVIKPSIERQRDELASNIENLADLFFADEIPSEKVQLQQQIEILTKVIDTLYVGVKNTYTRQTEFVSELSNFFAEMTGRCQELILAAEEIMQSSQELCDKSSRLLDYSKFSG
jgi:hypothetical protein